MSAGGPPVPSLSGKVLLVTGGSSGIGLATARLFLEEGAAVAIVARHRQRLDQVAAKLSELGEVEPLVADVASFVQAQHAVSATVERFGGLDYVFCCAGIPGVGRAEDLAEYTWDEVMAVNLKGVYTVVHAAIPHLRSRGGGAIVTTGSEVGLTGFPGHSAYCASKAGVINFTRAVALEVIDDGIRVNCLAPGLTATPMSERGADLASDPAAVRASWKSWSPAGRSSDPREHAKAVLYLMRDATFSIGSVLVQDGGFTAR